jgi:putative methionine-R-sulfoxide reductase with GAF domain
MTPDLSEIVDISEDGMAIQTSAALEANRTLDLCLDLSETKTYIRTHAQVVWSNRLGRTGLRFPDMPDTSLHELRQWLFFNALVACANHTAAPALLPAARLSMPGAGLAATRATPAQADFDQAAPPDYTSILTALAAVKREVGAIGPHLEAALNLVVMRAQTFTRASSAAVALSQGEGMICCASTGSDAPAVGTRLQVGSGFSGECVRSGRLLRCDDSETDTRVDRESCRLLGIRSMAAVPVRLGETVVGLLEVFSPRPRNFGPNDDVILQHLAETVLAAVNRAARLSAGNDVSFAAPSPTIDTPPETITEAEKPSSRSHRVFLFAAATTLILVVLWLTIPWITSWTSSRRTSAQAPPKPQANVPKPPAATAADVTTMEELRKLAEQGDPTAQFAVGRHYATGDEVKQDYVEAARWFGLAADRGYVPAQSALGAYYWSGRGVPKDLNKAYFWSVLAQTGGDESSKYLVAAISSSMSRRQLLEVQQQAGDWLKQHPFISSKPSPAR